MVLAAQASQDLSTGGWRVRGSESAAVTDRLRTEFGETGSSLIVLYRTSDGGAVTDEAVQSAMTASLAGLEGHALVSGITRWEARRPIDGLLSTDGTATYVVADLRATDEESSDIVDELRSHITPQPGLTFQLTGYGPLSQDSNRVHTSSLSPPPAIRPIRHKRSSWPRSLTAWRRSKASIACKVPSASQIPLPARR